MLRLVSTWCAALLLTCLLAPPGLAAQGGAGPAQVASSAPTRPTPDWQALQTRIARGEFAPVITRLTELLREPALAPADERQANLLLGAAYYGQHQYAAANPPLRRVLALDPGNHEAIKLLGLDDYFLGKPREAVPYLEQARQWMPGQVDLEYLLTVCYVLSGDQDGARAAAAHMLGLDPGTPAARLALARVLVQRQMEASAVHEVQQALAADPTLPLAHYLLGVLDIVHGQNDAARQEFVREIALNPTYGNAFYRLGDAEYRLGHLPAARTALSRAIWLDPTYSGPYILMGKLLLQEPDPELAARMLHRATELDPNNYDAHYLLGRALQQLQQPAAAAQEFALSQKLRPKTEGNFGLDAR
ncbi:MAG: tetratricopeptide repeat protein [Terriglobales bacterium]